MHGADVLDEVDLPVVSAVTYEGASVCICRYYSYPNYVHVCRNSFGG